MIGILSSFIHIARPEMLSLMLKLNDSFFIEHEAALGAAPGPM
jgi:hypothetical protein